MCFHSFQVFVQMLGTILRCTNTHEEEQQHPQKISPNGDNFPSNTCDNFVSNSRNNVMTTNVDDALSVDIDKSDIPRAMYCQLLAIKTQMFSLEESICDIKDTLAHTTISNNKQNMIAHKWRILASVLDRIFLIIQVVVICLSAMFLFPSSNFKYDNYN